MTRHTLTKMKPSAAIACTGPLPKELCKLKKLETLFLCANDALKKPPGCPLDSCGQMSYTSKDEVKKFLRCLGKKSQACLLQ